MSSLSRNFTRLMITLTGVLIFLIVLSITLGKSAHAAEENKLPVPVSINALMVTLIDHSAHYIWDYGSMPREISADEWRTVQYYAIQLAGSGPLITLGGSGPSDEGWAAAPQWTDMARKMSEGAMLALDAAANQDREKLISAGNDLVDACESCHEVFKPEVPTEGITHMPDYDFLYHLFSAEP
ncbi:MAG: hypothetical protein V4628_15635 [Pseudomonadota bacterium]